MKPSGRVLYFGTERGLLFAGSDSGPKPFEILGNGSTWEFLLCAEPGGLSRVFWRGTCRRVKISLKHPVAGATVVGVIY